MAYMTATEQSYTTLARRISTRLGRKIAPGTLRAICNGGGCRTDVAQAIIAESRANPAPTGTVELADLVRDAG